MNEAIIVNALNNFVRNGMSEQVKAERRAAGLKDSPVAAAQQVQSAMRAVTPLDKLLEVEGLLVQLIIHHGDQLITVQDVDGNDVEVAVAQYISLDLGGDGFKFHNDLYNQIMQEAVEHLEKKMILSPKLILPIIRIRKSAGWQVCLQVTRRYLRLVCR